MTKEPIEIPASELPADASRWERFKVAFRAWYQRRRFYLWFGGFVFTLLIVAFGRHMFFTIPSGHAGVVFRRFFGGTETSYVRDEGFQFIFAWDGLTLYDVRIQQVSHAFEIISHDGLEVKITLSIRYRPRVQLLGVLHKEVGPNYVNTIVIPEVQSLARATFGAYTPEEMYTTKRSLIEETLQRAIGQVAERYVELDDLLIKEIKLPPLLQASIENKLIEQQNSLAMHFRIDRERMEAERKAIEAVGVARFNETIRAGLNEDLLRYKGIDATLKLAESANAKVVVLGNHDGLPLILDTSGASSPKPASGATAAPPPAAPATVSGGVLSPGGLARVPAMLPAATPDSLNVNASATPPPSGPTNLAPPPSSVPAAGTPPAAR